MMPVSAGDAPCWWQELTGADSERPSRLDSDTETPNAVHFSAFCTAGVCRRPFQAGRCAGSRKTDWTRSHPVHRHTPSPKEDKTRQREFERKIRINKAEFRNTATALTAQVGTATALCGSFSAIPTGCGGSSISTNTPSAGSIGHWFCPDSMEFAAHFSGLRQLHRSPPKNQAPPC